MFVIKKISQQMRLQGQKIIISIILYVKYMIWYYSMPAMKQGLIYISGNNFQECGQFRTLTDQYQQFSMDNNKDKHLKIMLGNCDQRFKHLFSEYLKTNMRCDQFLHQLPVLFNMNTNSYKTLSSVLQFPCAPITALKFLIMIHRILCQGTDRAQVLEDVLSVLETQDNSDFDQMLTIKLIKPYKLFLQKRVVMGSEQLNKSSIAFSLVNLLWRGMSFVDMLYTFGRYYIYSYPFFIDFNITLGMDIKTIYQVMVRNINKQNKEILLPELQKLHQKMYVVYYNCYFYKHLKPFIPKWVITQQKQYSSSKSIFSNSTANSNSKNERSFNMGANMMGQSMIVTSPAQNQQDQSRMEVIKSMQRIVSLFG